MVYQRLINLELFRKPCKFKAVNILKYMNTQIYLTLRSIVAGPNCPTRYLSNLVNIVLKPFLIHIKSFIIKDNLDFLTKCSRKNKWDTI